jgi:hypothetical protein
MREQSREPLRGVGRFHAPQHLQALRRPALARGGERIDHAAAAQRAARGGIAHDEGVARERADRLLGHDLH